MNPTPVSTPHQLAHAFVACVNAGDLDGLIELYEQGAVLELPDGSVATGAVQIRGYYRQLLDGGPQLTVGDQAPTLVADDLALTSTRIPGGTTVEIARRQPDGTWRWVVDRPRT